MSLRPVWLPHSVEQVTGIREGLLRVRIEPRIEARDEICGTCPIEDWTGFMVGRP